MGYPHFSNDCDEYHALVVDFGQDDQTSREAGRSMARPSIVCLCGSTRFYETFREQNLRLTLQGKIVLSIGCDTKSDGDLAEIDGDFEQAKGALDHLHKRKIDLADEVLILNVGGYIGDSTRSEIEYAQRAGKPITYLEAQADPVFVLGSDR